MGTTDYPELINCRILVVEDAPQDAYRLERALSDVGAIVTSVSSVDEAINAIDRDGTPFDVAIVDMYIPEKPYQHHDRNMRGEELAVQIRKRLPATHIVAISSNIENPPITPIPGLFSGFIFKPDIPTCKPPLLLFETLSNLLNAGRRRPRVFIVHGHDKVVYELKDYIQNTLGLGEPEVLRDEPSLGKTVIEKFEDEVRRVDVVFVLLTPEDGAVVGSEPRLARQNVIFELGFFYAQMKRTNGKTIVLIKGSVELPSDISGILCIDISNGIRSAGEEIRRELHALGWI